jgi:diguanylate cyclase (GGDEF)-like protein/PAS domain S-box-containing protein
VARPFSLVHRFWFRRLRLRLARRLTGERRPQLPLTSDLGERERMLSTLLGNLDGMVFRCRNDACWTMEFVSEGCLELTGYATHEVLLNRRIAFAQLIHPDDESRVRAVVEQALVLRERYELEYRIVHADGSVRWVAERGAGNFDAQGQLLSIDGIIQDVSRRKQSEHALMEAEKRYRGIFENALEGMFQSSRDGRFLSVNPALARLYGYDSPTQLVAELNDLGRRLYVQPGRRDAFVRIMEQEGSVSNFESEVYRRDGSIIWISENCRAVTDSLGQLICYEGTVESITERKRDEDRIRHQATHDSLTGLPNRALLYETLRQRIERAEQLRQPLAVAFIDLDHFKLVNDSLGHAAGDLLLQTVAERLRRCLRDGDLVARQSGDEFVLLIAGDVHPASLKRIGQRLLRALARPCHIAGQEFTISCSIGFAIWPEHGRDIDTLLGNADIAMYQAKELGRNNYKLFQADMKDRIDGRLQLQSELHRAVEAQTLALRYEPRFAVRDSTLIGAEVRVCWPRAEGEMGSELLWPLAEETGLSLPIGDWLLRMVCLQLRHWCDEGLPLLPLALSVTRRQLLQGDFVGSLGRQLEDSDVSPAWLCVQIPEQVIVEERERASRIVAQLHRLGVGVSVVEFGAGFTSLNELRHLAIQALKLDRRFTEGFCADRATEAITKAILSVGHVLGLELCAEGVESAEELAFLRQQGCRTVQGPYLGLPTDALSFSRLLHIRRVSEAPEPAQPVPEHLPP